MGNPKTRLDHAYLACALNLLRLEAFWNGTCGDRLHGEQRCPTCGIFTRRLDIGGSQPTKSA